MRFFCPELENLTVGQLVQLEGQNQQSKRDDYQQPTGIFRALLLSFARDRGDAFAYCNEGLHPVLGSFARSRVLQTKAAFATAEGVTLTDNSGLSTSFAWVAQNWNQVRSGFWWTVLTETGVVFQRPAATGEYIGEVLESDVVGLTEGYPTISYQGETTADILISADVEYIRPVLIDTTLKRAAVNKARSRRSVVMFTSAGEWSPGDWTYYNGAAYVIISRRTVVEAGDVTAKIYSAVLASEDADTFAGGDVVPDYDGGTMVQVTTVSTTAAYTIGGWEQYIRYTGTGNATWTLPAATGTGRRFMIKHQGTGALRVNRAGSDYIDRVDTNMISYRDQFYGLTDAATGKWEVF